jgi:C4-dicarboxylate-specific signal transduction histidine kinase
LQRQNQDLEQRVIERTRRLEVANEALRAQIAERRRAEEQLRAAQDEIARVARLTTLGTFAASVAHEINQPLTGAVANSEAALRWLRMQPPNFKEAHNTVKCALTDANRAAAVIKRVRSLLTRARPRFVSLDINDVIGEVLALTRSEQTSRQISVQTKLSSKLSPVRGDRVQLQQVMLNLILNAIEAMSANKKRPRNLLITSRMNRAGSVLIAVSDTGPASILNRRAGSSTPSSRRKPKAWGWVCRSASRSSRRTAGVCGRRPIPPAVPYSDSRYRRQVRDGYERSVANRHRNRR